MHLPSSSCLPKSADMTSVRPISLSLCYPCCHENISNNICFTNLCLVPFVSSAPYLATQALDSSLLIQPNPIPSTTQSSSSQSSSNLQTSMASGGSALNNNSAASNSGSGLPGNTNNTPSSSSGPQGSSIQSAKPSSFPPFGSMGVQGNSSQSGALGQQAVTQNSSLSGDNSAVNSQTQGPSEPPERYAMHLLLFPVLIETSCIRLP